MRFVKCLGVVLFFANVFLSTCALSLEKKDILFYLPVNENLKAQIAGGSANPVAVEGSPLFTVGHSGEGLLIGDSTQIAYPTQGNFQLEAGSIAMWVKPLNWGKGDSYMRFFFKIGEAADGGGAGAGNFAWLYKYFSINVFWLVQRTEPTTKTYAVNPISGGQAEGLFQFDWTEGEWTHLIATWAENQIALYINGELAGVNYVPTHYLLQRVADRFFLGGKNSRAGGTADTVIDEFLILGKNVSPVEAKNIYKKGLLAFEESESKQDGAILRLDSRYLILHDSIKLDVDIVGLSPDIIKGSVFSYKIQNEKTGDVVASDTRQLWNVRSIFTLYGNMLTAGGYSLTGIVEKDGKKLAGGRSSFEKHTIPDWFGNTIGIVSEVPAPWSPIEYEKKSDTLTCWGRTYTWNKNALPSQINTQNQNLLARPITLAGKINGRESTLARTEIFWEKTEDTEGRYIAKTFLDELPVTVKGRIEYDGFLWLDISVGEYGIHGNRLDFLVLDIPLSSEVATLMNGRFPDGMTGIKRPGKVVSCGGKIGHNPVFWLGNEKGGLQCSVRDYSDWHLKNEINMLSLNVEENEVLLRITYVDHPIYVYRPLNYTLGIQATPVRPLPENWRTWEFAINNIKNQYRLPYWMLFWNNWNRIGDEKRGPFGYQVASENTMKDLKTWHEKNLYPWIYWHMAAVWLGDPVVKIFGGEWGGKPYQENAHPYAVIQDPNHDFRSVRDYFIWRWWKLLKENPELTKEVPGIYLDCCGARWLDAVDGRDIKVYTILGTREMQKRFYTLIKKEWPHLLICNHQSGNISMSQLAFSDMLITGEEYRANPRLTSQLNYYDILTYERLRAEYFSAKFGIPQVFLPQITAAIGTDKAKKEEIDGDKGILSSEHLLGMLWVHDIIPWYSFVNTKPFTYAGRAKEKFGWDDDTEFIPYWDSEKFLTMRNAQPEIVTSIFIRKDRVLFVTMSDSDTDADIELLPDWNNLGIKAPAFLVDIYSEQKGEEMKVMLENDGSIRFPVKRRNFRALVAR